MEEKFRNLKSAMSELIMIQIKVMQRNGCWISESDIKDLIRWRSKFNDIVGDTTASWLDEDKFSKDFKSTARNVINIQNSIISSSICPFYDEHRGQIEEAINNYKIASMATDGFSFASPNYVQKL